MIHERTIFIYIGISSLFSWIIFTATAQNNTINIPAGYESCSCAWSEWMNSDNPSDDNEQETYSHLKNSGYQFCEKPIDIQCYNLAQKEVISPPGVGSVTCSVDIGLSCNFFCDDYKVRVACCYCPPDAIGPAFQIVSEHNENCLEARGIPEQANARVEIASCEENEAAQLWSWVSVNQLKNVMREQCMSANLTASGSIVITTDCDARAPKQLWNYDKLTKSLSESVGYLNSHNGMFTTSSSKSKWIAQVDIGKIDINILQGWPCEAEPPPPDFGSVNCSMGSYQGSECRFKCNRGYRLPANAQYPVICMKNRQYNGSTPMCEKITCKPALTSPAQGRVSCSDSNNMASRCAFTCIDGYKLVEGSAIITCSEKGTWSSPRSPHCRRIECPELSVISHGSINCSNSNFYRSLCSYSCDQGYELEGSRVQLCLNTDLWNATTPVCNKIQCTRQSTLLNGDIKCTDGRNYMSSCQFSCEEGYTLVGSGSTTCNSDKTWGSVSPNCQRKTCTEMVHPSHGSVSCSEENFYGSKCTFNCEEGYRIEGASTLSCTGKGWDQGSPTCSRISCSHLLDPVGGSVTCTDHDFYDSKCTFSCREGYEVKGSKVVVCGRDDWSASGSTCEKIRCPQLQTPKNGQVSCFSENEYQSVCLFSCDDGYVGSDSESQAVQCMANGEWSGVPQKCKRIQCRRLVSLRKGSVGCSDGNNYNSKCSFTCNDGFNLYGATEAVCGKNGWGAQTPTCVQVQCRPPPSQPANGLIKCSGKARLTCKFSCNQGFRLEGINNTECRNDETWSEPGTPRCLRIRCADGIKQIVHGTVDCTDGDMFESVCSYSCKKGYSLQGASKLRCSETGSWDERAPTCRRVSCPVLSRLSQRLTSCTDSYFFLSICSFSCQSGYELIGVNSTRCQLNETWSNRLPYCERFTCNPGFSNPSNGKVTCTDLNSFDSVCSFKCDDGFEIVGDAKAQCGVNGWSVRSAPSCKKITCDDDSELENGAESCDGSNDYRSTCSYECYEGYKLLGKNKRVCQLGGTWSHQKPKCTILRCPTPPQINHGFMYCPQGHVYNSECSIRCEEGFRRVGSAKIRCTKSQQWTRFPACELIPTTTLFPLRNTSPVAAQSTTDLFASTTFRPPTNVLGEISPDVTIISPTTTATDSFRPESNGHGEAEGTQPDEVITFGVDDGGFPIIPVVVGASVVIVLIIVIAFVVFCLRRDKKTEFTKGIPLQESRYDDGQLQKLLSNGSSSRRFQAILLDRLESEFARKHADDDKLFREEFSSLPDGRGSREHGGKAVNKEKNRYTNVIPYDHSRVVLPKSNQSDNDYINASFIDGYKHKGKFIAAQGPKESTITDFWRMVWDQNVTSIIMVTNLIEGKELKCAQYWPQSGSQAFGDLNVVFAGENHLVDYTVRKFTIQQVQGESTLSMRRNLMHYHFTSWPDFGVPKTPSGMLKFLRKIKHGSPTGYGAIVVHCSAGVGRTGTFICIDAMLDMMVRENKVDVFGFVSQMRAQRPEMVQTEQQYVFIYQALLEHHLYGDTEVEATEVSSHIDELNQRLPGNVTGMEHEFKKLTTIRIQKEQMRAGNHPANMRKNRVLLILPYDWNRVILPIKTGVENSDYINASYIDGYRQKDAYIATQGPLPHTVEDFWRMIWDSKSASIVMLTELVERGQAKCEQYWPDDGAMIYGNLKVENIAEHELDNYTTRDLVVTSTTATNDRKQLVRQFHYHGWPESGPPVSGFSMIALVEQVQRQQQTSGNQPITIHCSAGAGRTGAFCALSTALEQVKAEGVLDMFQIVKCLRMQRPHMVQNIEQYEFCYRAVQEYIDSMSEYCNFK